MVEALRIREIDQMIESFQKDVERPNIVTPAPMKIKVQTATPELLVDTETPSKVIVEQEPEIEKVLEEIVAPVVVSEGLVKFQLLIEKITDRNYELGECFTKSISFVSYEDNVLTWESCANEKCKKSLTHGYSVVKQLVREIFSFQTKIKGIACSKPQETEEVKKEAVYIPDIEQPAMQEHQSTTMIEDAELAIDSSCASNCDDPSPVEEINGTDITQEPIVQKAIEMFEAKKVTIQSKI